MARRELYDTDSLAEEKLGRALTAKELIHHINGNRQDNRPGNIDVLPSIAHHLRQHTGRDDLHPIGEDNPIVVCACGCGQTFLRFDRWSRPRRFVSGHNMLCKGGQ